MQPFAARKAGALYRCNPLRRAERRLTGAAPRKGSRALSMPPLCGLGTRSRHAAVKAAPENSEAASISYSNREAKSALYAHSLFSLRMKQTTTDNAVLMNRSAAMTKFSGASPGMPKQTTPVK